MAHGRRVSTAKKFAGFGAMCGAGLLALAIGRRHQRRALRELRENEWFLDSLIENIPNMVFVKEANRLSFVRFNRAGEELLGYSRAELIGKSDRDFFPPAEAEFFIEKDRLVLASGKAVDIPEEPIHTRLKGTRILHTKKVPIYGPDRRPLFLLGISEDITDRKRAETERDRARDDIVRLKLDREVRERFISTLSHDLRTPITAAKVDMELIERFPERVEMRAPLLRLAVQSMERADRMIRDLLDVSRLRDRHTLPLQLEPMEIREFLSSFVEQLSPLYENRVRLGPCPECAGTWSPDGLRRILENLVSNGIKYGDRAAPVTIAAERSGDRILISVHNEGKALPQQDVNRLFEPFQREGGAESCTGWGLGLTIVRGLTEAHAGTVSVVSEAGRGTTFTINLPIVARPGLVRAA